MITKTLLSIAVLALAMATFPQQGFPAEDNEQAVEATAATDEVSGSVAAEANTAETAVAESVSAEGEAAEEEMAEEEMAGAEKLSIMDKPLDGSSLESFEAGMEKVKTDASVGDYERLKSALEYLLVFDLGANRDRAKLYANLDGQTPTEIIAMPAYGRLRP